MVLRLGGVQTEYVSFRGRLAPSTSPIKNILVPKYTGEKICARFGYRLFAYKQAILGKYFTKYLS